MASGLFALFDDIALLMDDTAVMTKVAAKKTAGIVGDDLAVNAEAMVGINPKRELAIVGAVAKGSLINKAILVPSALLLAAIAPPVITYGLMFGGAFLCYEAFHKTFGKHDSAHDAELIEAAHTSTEATLAVERQKIKQAITTDFILSAEIIAIALGSMTTTSLTTQALSLVVIALGMTVIVYGAVAGLVKIDDLGIWMAQRGSAIAKKVGLGLVASVPYIMKALGIIGTTAMFLVGGSIVLHGLPIGHSVAHLLESVPAGGLRTTASMLCDLVSGIIVGGLAAVLWHFAKAPVSTGFQAVKKLLPIKRKTA